jgi:hypothetical protein
VTVARRDILDGSLAREHRRVGLRVGPEAMGQVSWYIRWRP